MPEYRLGDVIDDYCVKCKRIMNHSVVSILNQEPAKVRCRTCHSDHDYRHEQAPPPKVDPRKAALFNEVLSKMGASPADVAEVEDPAEIHEADEPVEVSGPPPEAKIEPKPKPLKAKAKRQK